MQPAAGVRNVPGAGVEEVTEPKTAAKDREDTVLAAAAGILQAATPTAAMNALTGHLMGLFDLTWLALADDDLASFMEVHGEVSPAQVRVPPLSPKGRGAAPTRPTTRQDPASSSRSSPTRGSPFALDAPPPSGDASARRSLCSSWW